MWLAWVTILSDEVASVTSQHVVFDFSLSTFCKVYHFPNAGKMIFNLFSSIKASVFCSFYDSFKSFPFGITQYLCKFSCTPALYAFIFLAIASNCSNNSLIFSSFIIVYFSIILQKYTFYLVAARKSYVIFIFFSILVSSRTPQIITYKMVCCK